MRAALLSILVALLVVLSACSVSSVPETPARPNKVVMGYYPSWDKAAYDHTQVPYENLTHIAHAFAWPDADGDLVVPADLLYPALNAAAHAAGVKMILSLGGWGNCAGFPPMAASSVSRTRFIGQLVDFCKANAYDGVDIDWEFVEGDQQKADFVLFIEALGAALKAQSPPLLLTMAANSGDYYGRWIDFERLADDFDYIGFMTYDYHGEWSDHSGHNSPLYDWGSDGCGSLDGTYLYARSRQVPAAKILVGVAFFGRSFDCGGLGLPFAVSAGWDYKDVADLPAAVWARSWDGQAQVPFKVRTDGTMIICYDDPSSVSLKCQYVKDKASAGVIIWALGGDSRAGRSELLEVVGKSFGVR
ncbi:MAG TPA: glycoside hydrolase family 18 protein [Acidobacteriota bacterium]|nr:glycoside hydrolase family 18 protein [Acidobacteriota bacterium]